MEKFPGPDKDSPAILGKDLPSERKGALLTERIKKYAQRVYKRVSAKPETEVKTAGICQRENSFYVDTVRSFRDRRYEYKGLVKKWKGKLGAASKSVRASIQRWAFQ
jgi:DNA polymerase epsilon subunit 1